MISFHQIRLFVITMILATMLAITIGFDFGHATSWAATPLTELSSEPQIKIATMNRVEAFTKNVEGKTQEAIGNITGNRNDQVAGKAKQVESQARNVLEDVKDNVRGIFN
jgi:uncharacterized protein YjbJ (UPF0337 family)